MVVAWKRATRRVMRRLFSDPERFELLTGLTLFTVSVLLFLAGWTVFRETPGEWVGVPAGILAAMGTLGLSGKVPVSALILNRGLAGYEPKRGGQIAVIYGAALFGLGVFGLSSLPYGWLAPSGSYGLAVLLGAALILGGLYIVATTPILEPSQPAFEADQLPTAEPAMPWYVVDDQEMAAHEQEPSVPLMPSTVEPRYAVPQVRLTAAAKRPSLLQPDDILAYAMIECDWVETPTNYSCIRVDENSMSPVLEAGDVVGINHAIVDPAWLSGKLVVACTPDNKVAVGFLQQKDGVLMLQPRDESHPAVEVQAVGVIGAVEWSLKPTSKFIRPAEAVGTSIARRRGPDENRPSI